MQSYSSVGQTIEGAYGLCFSLEVQQQNKRAKLILKLQNLSYLSVNAVNSEHLSTKSFSSCGESKRSGFKVIAIHTTALQK